MMKKYILIFLLMSLDAHCVQIRRSDRKVNQNASSPFIESRDEARWREWREPAPPTQKEFEAYKQTFQEPAQSMCSCKVSVTKRNELRIKNDRPQCSKNKLKLLLKRIFSKH